MPATLPALPLAIAPLTPCSSDGVLPGERALPALYDYLAQVPDPRDPRGLRHPLPALLGQVSCALLCGARSLTAVADWGRDYAGPLVATLGYTRARTPCCATFHAVLQDLDWTALEGQLRAWALAVEDCLGAATPAASEEALALDGKTLRGALKMGADVTALVTALGHRFGLTAGAVEVVAGDEIAAVQTLLARLCLGGKVVTVDALHTQRKTAQLILAQQGEYVMTVKGNQPDLQEAIVSLFAPELAAAQERESAWETTQGHGRIENRRLLTVRVPSDAPPALATWPGAQQVFVLERHVWKRKQRLGQRELVYGVTSLSRSEASAADLSRFVRGHWRIETRSHWVRDVTFGEDASLVRTGKIPQVMAVLRAMVITRFRADGVTNIARETRRLAAQVEGCLRLLGLATDN